jgi:hypothetical protein
MRSPESVALLVLKYIYLVFQILRKRMTKLAEKQEKPDNKGLILEQDALYQAYASQSPEWHQNMTRRLLRKVDWHLLPFLILMYLLNFLDRK